MTSVRIYQPSPANGFSWVHPVDEVAREYLLRPSGERIGDWVPPTVEFAPSNDRAPESDRMPEVPWRGENTLIFSNLALELARPVLDPWGQFLELRVENSSESLWLYNVTTVVDALDEAESIVHHFPDGVRIIYITSWALRREALQPGMVFRIPKQRTLLLSGEVVDELMNLRLTGTQFKLLWSAD